MLAHGACTLRTLIVSSKSRPDDGDRAHRPGGASTTSVVATLIGEYTVFSLNFWIEPEAIIDASVFFKPL